MNERQSLREMIPYSSCSQQPPIAASLKNLLEMQILVPYLHQLWGASLSNYVPVRVVSVILVFAKV